MKKILPLLPLLGALALFGCASGVPQKTSRFFALPEIEGVVRADGPVGLDEAKLWVGVVITRPEEYKDRTVMFRFKNTEDPNYRLLTSNDGRTFRITARNGEGIFSREAIVFISNHPASFTLLPTEPSQPRPTTPPSRDDSS